MNLPFPSAGSVNGWVKESIQVWQHDKKVDPNTDDYHGDIDHAQFKKWVVNDFLDHIPPGSYVIMDNGKNTMWKISKNGCKMWTLIITRGLKINSKSL